MQSVNINPKNYYVISALLCMMVLTSCHTVRKTDPNAGRHHNTEALHVGHGDKVRHRIVEEAMTWMGTPYKYAGTDKGEGVDCSGMVMCVYQDAIGMKLPRNSSKQAEFCKSIKAEEVALGDLVFFATGKDPERVSHVGIVVDDSHFIHASSSKGVVVSDIFAPYYQRTFIMYGRVPVPDDHLADNK